MRSADCAASAPGSPFSRRSPSAVAVGLLCALAAGSGHGEATLDELAWAYAIAPEAAAPAQPATPAVQNGSAADDETYSLPDTTRRFTRAQIADRFGPADWYPGDHPSMPPIVARGREEAGIWACSLCHYPNGKGRPENAGVAGLPKAYFVQQLHDFRAGARLSTEPRKANTNYMVSYAAAMTDEEIEQAAEYFSALPWTPWIEVVETETVPKTRIAGGMHLRLEGDEAGEEPLGQRIVESPLDAERTEMLRDPRSGFIAYVPVGAVAKGEALATTGGDGKSTPCGICHGEDLTGLALVPPLRGRSPSYIARQLLDFQHGRRQGAWSELMTGVVANLTAEDIVNLSAYLASLQPGDD